MQLTSIYELEKALRGSFDGVISAFGDTYLQRPTKEDMQRLLYVGEMRGFPGMIGSIDCMHWEWKNCPSAWAGQFSGKEGKPTIVLEAVASYDLWIWHAFFGTPGTCNDINVLDRSPVFDDVLQGVSPPVDFVVNGRQYNMSYYLADGIYPPWATFIPSIKLPQGDKAKLFAHCQEGTRKDVERAFGVLQARFAIIKNPSLAWDITLIGRIMRACIILHNMIVEDERDTYNLRYDFSHFDHVGDNNNASFTTTRLAEMEYYLEKRMQIRNRITHYQLKEDLVEHIWQKFGHANV